MKRVVIINNFPPDKQESMLRFTSMLERGLEAKGYPFTTLSPRACFSKLVKNYRFGGASKYLGYIDKLLLFPRALKRIDRKSEDSVIHIVDHSNATYAKAFKRLPVITTCHDLLAVRGALGEDTDCPATWMGKKLQKGVLKGLAASDHVACVSGVSRNDLLRLSVSRMGIDSSVVHNGINHPFKILSQEVIEARIRPLNEPRLSTPYVFHIGSDLPRKNRATIIKALHRIKDSWQGNIVFAGAPLSESEEAVVYETSLQDRIIEIHGPDNDIVEALYNKAHALVFPSTTEGFGWPIIEAQSCGCPVVCSNQTSLPEVAGNAAYTYDPYDTESISKAILDLQNPDTRSQIIAKGLENTKGFETPKMIDAYIGLYNRVSKST